MQSAVSWFAVLEGCSVGSFEWLLLHPLHISPTGCNLASKSPPFFSSSFRDSSQHELPQWPRVPGCQVSWAANPFFMLWLTYLLILSGEVALEYTASFMCCCSTFSPGLWTLALPSSKSVHKCWYISSKTLLTAISWSRWFRPSFLF